MPSESNFMMRAVLVTSVASLGLNVYVASVVLRQPPAPSLSQSPFPSSSKSTGPTAADGQAPFQFKNAWEYVDHATGRRMQFTFTDDGGKYERFVTLTHLDHDRENALRDRWTDRRRAEMKMAEEMVKAGSWDAPKLRRLQTEFWASEFKKLSNQEQALLPPEFFPVP